MKGLFVLRKEEVSVKEFISFWSNLYHDGLVNDNSFEQKYSEKINNKLFSKDDILNLYTWKNTQKLSQKKLTGPFLKQVIKKLSIINKLKNKFDDADFEEQFGDFSDRPIWFIFLKHIIQPETFPIFDQHMYRSFRFIQNGVIEELSQNNNVVEIYEKEYVPFFKNIIFSNEKKIDEALFTFGKFIKDDASYWKAARRI